MAWHGRTARRICAGVGSRRQERFRVSFSLERHAHYGSVVLDNLVAGQRVEQTR